jgi:integrase
MKENITKNKLKGGITSWGYVLDLGRGPDGKRSRRVRKGFKRESLAEDALREAVSDRAKGNDIPKDSRTFETFFNSWLAQHGAGHWGKMTLELNYKRAAYAIRMFGDIPIQKLSAMRLEQAFGTLLTHGGVKSAKHPEGRPLSPKTVREVSALTSQCLDKAVKWKLIERNPMDDVERATVRKREVEIIEPDEYEKLLNRVKDTRYFALCVVSAALGCRRGEILALKWSDIDPNSGVVTISKSASKTKAGLEVKSPKNGKTRFVRISVATLQVLQEHKAQIEEEMSLFGSDYKPNNLVFPTPDGDYYNPDQVTGRIREFMAEAGVNASLHSLRHFSASMMLSQNVPITVVSKRLGHANSQITLDVYSHAMKNDELTAAILWDDATGDIIARTRKQMPIKGPAKAAGTFGHPKRPLLVVNG